MAEELELVTSFESLRAGDLVEMRPCGVCRRRGCRFMLMRKAVAQCGPGFPRSTNCDDRDLWVCAHTVASGHLHRVLIPPAAETRETARPKTLERVK